MKLRNSAERKLYNNDFDSNGSIEKCNSAQVQKLIILDML